MVHGLRESVGKSNCTLWCRVLVIMFTSCRDFVIPLTFIFILVFCTSLDIVVYIDIKGHWPSSITLSIALATTEVCCYFIFCFCCTYDVPTVADNKSPQIGYLTNQIFWRKSDNRSETRQANGAHTECFHVIPTTFWLRQIFEQNFSNLLLYMEESWDLSLVSSSHRTGRVAALCLIYQKSDRLEKLMVHCAKSKLEQEVCETVTLLEGHPLGLDWIWVAS